MISLQIKKVLDNHNVQSCNLINDIIIKNYIAKYYYEDWSFNWIEIGNILNIDPRNELKFEFSYTNCLNAVELLRPLYVSTINALNNVNQDFENLQKSLLWLDSGFIINHLFSKSRTETYDLESILLCTSFLEFELGNIYFSLTKKTPPHLLRDLLKTEELGTFFGKIPITFLQILLGTPNSINLRNIVWHGFPTINDLPTYHNSTLILTLISFSRIIQDKTKFHIISRNKNFSIPLYFEKINLHYNEDFEFDSLVKYFDEQTLIPTEYRTIWLNIFHYFSDSNYSYCALLLLPQMELILRILYRDANDYNIQAKLDTYYIIIDTIFELKQPSSNEMNNIFNTLSNGVISLLYDIFISHNGPRIRDKISHGEIDLSTINQNICVILISLSLSLCSVYKNDQIKHYESKFHPSSVLVQKLKKCAESLQQLYAVKVPKILHYNLAIKYDLVLHEHIKLTIFHRPTKESEIITLLGKIVENIYNACKNLLENLEKRFFQLENYTLRSRNKKTVINLLECFFQEFLLTVTKLLKFVEKLFIELQEKNFGALLQNKDFHLKTIKVLKNILKCAENLQQNCLITNSKWDKSLQICLKLSTQLDDHCTLSIQ